MVAAAATSFAADLLRISGCSPRAATTASSGTLSYGVFIGARLWGLVNAVTNGPAQAIYADSTPAGQRSWYYTILFGLPPRVDGSGPLVTIVMFVLHGNEWELADIRNVILAGMGIELLCAAFMLFFRDEYSLTEADEAAAAEPAAAPAAPLRRRCRRAPPPRRRRRRRHRAARRPDGASEVDGAVDHVLLSRRFARQPDDGEVLPALLQERLRDVARRRAVHLHRRPRADGADVGDRHQAAPRPGGARRRWSSSRSRRRAPTARWRTSTPTGSTTAAASRRRATATHPSRCTRSWWSSRSTCGAPLMNCTYPLEESILMDFAPKETRARWKSLDSNPPPLGWSAGGAQRLGTDKYSLASPSTSLPPSKRATS